eukprot:scaffold82474_cov19-Prasinocladus_malaysianus.AAC.1
MQPSESHQYTHQHAQNLNSLSNSHRTSDLQGPDRFQGAAMDRINRERTRTLRPRPTEYTKASRKSQRSTTPFHESAGANGGPNLAELKAHLRDSSKVNDRDSVWSRMNKEH